MDTVGPRRRARVETPLEKPSVGAATEALMMAERVALCVDAEEGLYDRDLEIARLVQRVNC